MALDAAARATLTTFRTDSGGGAGQPGVADGTGARTTKKPPGLGAAAGGESENWHLQGESNPCYRDENPMS